jgi:hypothetical protein
VWPHAGVFRALGLCGLARGPAVRFGALRGGARFMMARFAPIIDMIQRHFGAGAALVMQFCELFVAKILDRGEFVLRALHSQYQLRQLELQRQGIAVLRVLDQVQ